MSKILGRPFVKIKCLNRAFAEYKYLENTNGNLVATHIIVYVLLASQRTHAGEWSTHVQVK